MFGHYASTSAPHQGFETKALFSALKRHRAPLLIWVAVCLAVASTYVLTTPAEYTAYTQIILETPKRPHLLLDADGEAYPIDSAQADSRIQVIKSERLLRFVFDTLLLGNRTPKPASRRGLVAFFGQQPQATSIGDTPAFLDFMDRVSVRRIGISYVVEVAYRANDPKDAARTVNSITSAYIRDLVLSTPNDSQVLQRRISSVAHDADLLLAAIKDGNVPNAPIVGIDARVIGTAIVPLHKSAPHTTLTLFFAIIVGLITGIGTILFFHNRDRTIRSVSQARSYFGPDLLAVISRSSGYARQRKDAELIVQTLPTRKGHLRLGIGAAKGTGLSAFVARTVANRLAADTQTSLIITNRRNTRSDLGGDTQLDNTGLQVVDLTAGQTSVVEVKRQIDLRQKVGPVVVALPGFEAAALPVGIAKALDALLLIVHQDDTTKDEIDLAISMLQAVKVGYIGFVYVISTPETTSLLQELRRISATLFGRAKQPLLAWRMLPRG